MKKTQHWTLRVVRAGLCRESTTGSVTMIKADIFRLDFHNKDFAAQFAPDQASTSRQPLNRHSVHSVPGSSEMTFSYTEPLPETDKTDDEGDVLYCRGSRPSPD
jgi:hypothetical protein